MFELVILSGARAGVVVPAEHGMVAGRDATCALEVPDPSASRQHARFDWDGVELRLVDTKSSNGTYVNERPIQSERLQNGDTIRIGNTNLRVQQRATHPSVESHATGEPRTLAPERTIFGIGDTAEPYRTHSRPLRRADAEQGSPEARVLQHRLASMIRVSELLASARTPDGLFAPVLDALFELLPQTDRGFLLLGDSETNLRPQAVRRRRPSREGEAPPRVSRSICRAALETRSAFIYREGDDTPIDRGHSIVDLQIRSALALPLMIGEETLGLIVLDTRDPRQNYDQDDLELGVAVCHQVAIAMRSAQLVRAVEAETHDTQQPPPLSAARPDRAGPARRTRRRIGRPPHPGHRAVCRRHRLYQPLRATRPKRTGPLDERLLQPGRALHPADRGFDRQVHGRRDHGGLGRSV